MIRIFYFFLLMTLLSCGTKPGSLDLDASSIHIISSPSSGNSSEPFLFTDSNNQVFLSWVVTTDSSTSLQYAQWDNKKWSAPITIAQGSNWFINWADYPAFVSSGKDQLMAHILKMSGDGTYAYDVNLIHSSDGATWSQPILLHDDSTETEHGFVSLSPYNENVLVTWLDGRNTPAQNSSHEHQGHAGAMSLRAAIVGYNGQKISEWELDKRVCDCCQTTSAITLNGPVVIYRDRSEDEIRDISIVRYVNSSWTDPQPIFEDHWKIAGCPVNGPRCDALNNHLAIVWFSVAKDTSIVKLLLSKDGGATFGSPIQIDEGKPIGRVDVAWLNETTTLVTWMEEHEIKAVKVSLDGRKGKSVVVGSSSTTRASGFPQMTRLGNGAIFAWTDDATQTIKMSTLE